MSLSDSDSPVGNPLMRTPCVLDLPDFPVFKKYHPTSLRFSMQSVTSRIFSFSIVPSCISGGTSILKYYSTQIFTNR